MANNFSGDSSCRALWRFESGALTTDDIGSNTLTNYVNRVSADTDAGDYQEGAASARFTSAVSPRLYIDDADLDSGFPLKSSGSDTDFTLCFWLKLADTSANYILVAKNVYLGSDDESVLLYTRDYGGYYGIRVIKGYNSGNSNEVWEAVSSLDLQASRWYHIALSWDDTSKQFQAVVWDDTAQTKYTDSDTQTYGISLTTAPLNLGCRANSSGVPNAELNGWLDEVVVFNDVLTESQIDSIRQGTFGAGGTEHALSSSIGGTSVLSGSISLALPVSGSIDASASISSTLDSVTFLAGTCAVQSHLLAVAIVAGPVPVQGSTGAKSSLVALLRRTPSGASSTPTWLQESLLHGMTANAIELGTVLTGGWFWARRAGCSAVYKGPCADQIDLARIICVADSDAEKIVLPDHLAHEPGSSQHYLVRRFNASGHQEQTLNAMARVCIGLDGALASPRPNGVYGLHGRVVNGDRVLLRWSYGPLDQGVSPAVFEVHTDHGSGQLDLQLPLAAISYEGPGLHRYLSESLPEGRHLFSVVAQSADGVRSVSLSYLRMQVKTVSLSRPVILSAEVIS